MRLATMFRDALRSLFSRPVTRHYPVERTPTPERMRGKLVWNPDQCTGCQLCTKDCPADAIHLIVVDKATKQFEMHYDMNRCIFCGQCVESCRFDCITLEDGEWELAGDAREVLIVYKKEAAKQEEVQPEPMPE